MRHLRRIGLMPSLLFVGVLAGLTAPASSDAGTPTLTIDGLSVSLQLGGPGCTGADNFINGTVNGCYSIVGTNTTTDTTRSATLQIGNWWVGDYSSGNQARVLVNDVSPGTENMKLTGVTFTSATNTFVNSNTITTVCNAPTCRVGRVVLKNTFNAQNTPGTAGPFPWLMAVGGNFNPLSNENVVSNKFRLAGQGCFNATPCTPSAISSSDTGNNLGTINSGFIGAPTTNNLLGYITRDNPIITASSNCNNGSNRCQATLLYDYEIRIHGKDTLQLTDSVVGCGGSCNPDGPTNKLLGCGDVSTIGSLKYQCAQGVAAGLQNDRNEGIAAGGVEAQTCEGTCIIIIGEGTPANRAVGETFTFTATGQGVSGFDMTLDSAGRGIKIFSNLNPDTNPAVGDRFFTIPTYPDKNGTPWQTDQIKCTSAEGITGSTSIIGVDGNNYSDKLSLTVLTLAANDIYTCKWHVH